MESFVPGGPPVLVADDNQRVVQQGDSGSQNPNHHDLPQRRVEHTGTPHGGDTEVPRGRKQTRDADPKIQRG